MSQLDHAIDVAIAYDASTVVIDMAEARKLQSLVAELRALAEQMMKSKAKTRARLDSDWDDYDHGRMEATDVWAGELQSLLSAHGAAEEGRR